jgi:hypothetical protein
MSTPTAPHFGGGGEERQTPTPGIEPQEPPGTAPVGNPVATGGESQTSSPSTGGISDRSTSVINTATSQQTGLNFAVPSVQPSSSSTPSISSSSQGSNLSGGAVAGIAVAA